MYEEYTKAVPFVAEVVASKHPLQLLSGIDGVKSITEGSGALVEAFKEQNSNLGLLSKNELVKVGGSHGMKFSSYPLEQFPFLCSPCGLC